VAIYGLALHQFNHNATKNIGYGKCYLPEFIMYILI